MTNDELETIRARAGEIVIARRETHERDKAVMFQAAADRRNLIAAYDALAAAARKVCCGRCGLFPDEQSHDECTADCPDCADLRKLLEGER